jgi:hypothetical protein
LPDQPAGRDAAGPLSAHLTPLLAAVVIGAGAGIVLMAVA